MTISSNFSNSTVFAPPLESPAHPRVDADTSPEDDGVHRGERDRYSNGRYGTSEPRMSAQVIRLGNELDFEAAEPWRAGLSELQTLAETPEAFTEFLSNVLSGIHTDGPASFPPEKMEALRTMVAQGHFPPYEVSAELPDGVNGAYDPATNRILIREGADQSVYLEELGHYFDDQLRTGDPLRNGIGDAAGDEGRLFLEALTVGAVTAADIQQLKENHRTDVDFVDEGRGTLNDGTVVEFQEPTRRNPPRGARPGSMAEPSDQVVGDDDVGSSAPPAKRPKHGDLNEIAANYASDAQASGFGEVINLQGAATGYLDENPPKLLLSLPNDQALVVSLSDKQVGPDGLDNLRKHAEALMQQWESDRTGKGRVEVMGEIAATRAVLDAHPTAEMVFGFDSAKSSGIDQAWKYDDNGTTRYVFVEAKGGTSQLAPGQMSTEWIVDRLARENTPAAKAIIEDLGLRTQGEGVAVKDPSTNKWDVKGGPGQYTAVAINPKENVSAQFDAIVVHADQSDQGYSMSSEPRDINISRPNVAINSTEVGSIHNLLMETEAYRSLVDQALVANGGALDIAFHSGKNPNDRVAFWDIKSKTIHINKSGDFKASKVAAELAMEMSNASRTAEFSNVLKDVADGTIQNAGEYAERMLQIEYEGLAAVADVHRQLQQNVKLGASFSSIDASFERIYKHEQQAWMADQRKPRGSKPSTSELYELDFAAIKAALETGAQLSDIEQIVRKPKSSTNSSGSGVGASPGHQPSDGSNSGPEQSRSTPDGGASSSADGSSGTNGGSGRHYGAASFTMARADYDEESGVSATAGGTVNGSFSLGSADVSVEAGGSAYAHAGYTSTADRTSVEAQAGVEAHASAEVDLGQAGTVGVTADAGASVAAGATVNHSVDLANGDANVGATVAAGASVNAGVAVDYSVAGVDTSAGARVGAGVEAEAGGGVVMDGYIPGVHGSAGYDAGVAVSASWSVGTDEAAVTTEAGAIAGYAVGGGGAFGMQEDGKFHVQMEGQLALGIGVSVDLDIAFDPHAIKDRLEGLNPQEWGGELAKMVTEHLVDTGALYQDALADLDAKVLGPLRDQFDAAPDKLRNVVNDALNSSALAQAEAAVQDIIDDAEGFVEQAVSSGLGGAKDGWDKFTKSVGKKFKNAFKGKKKKKKKKKKKGYDAKKNFAKIAKKMATAGVPRSVIEAAFRDHADLIASLDHDRDLSTTAVADIVANFNGDWAGFEQFVAAAAELGEDRLKDALGQGIDPYQIAGVASPGGAQMAIDTKLRLLDIVSEAVTGKDGGSDEEEEIQSAMLQFLYYARNFSSEQVDAMVDEVLDRPGLDAAERYDDVLVKMAAEAGLPLPIPLADI